MDGGYGGGSEITKKRGKSLMIGLVPSILSADFTCLGEQVRAADAAGAQRIQIDIMDGHFVPNITMGPIVVEAVRRCTRLPLEAHLMITNPEQYIEDFAQAGADVIIVHQEVSPHLHRIIQQIKTAGKLAAIALTPSTPVFMLEDILSLLDMVLIMTVNPGFGGQEFIHETLPKIARLRQMITQRELHCDIEVDGGIHEATVPLVVRAGANLLVAGSAVYNQRESVSEAMARLRNAIPVLQNTDLSDAL
jgi:ribulose-phosphate 3-epimerase